MARDDITDGIHGADDAGVPLIPGLSPNRRAFLKLVGFSFVGAMLPGCSRGEEHDAVPFLDKPESVTPGLTQLYATGCNGCDAGCGLLARVRDGRPIKLEGNDTHPLSMGRTCAVGQAQVLGLYDNERLRGPLVKRQASNWDAVDSQVAAALSGAKGVRLLTGTVNSPTMKAQIKRFLAANPGAKHVSYDATSSSALLAAYETLYGKRVVPRYRLEHAEAIVSVDADFLGTWLSPVEFTRGYMEARELDGGGFGTHLQFESRVSLTGSNADRRFRAAPGDLGLIVFAIAERVAKAKGQTPPWGGAPKPDSVDAAALDAAAERLVEAGERAVLLCGVNDVRAQMAAAWTNRILLADKPAKSRYTVDLERPSFQAMGDDRAVSALVAEIEAGAVDVLFVMGCNPVYDLPGGDALGEALSKVGLVVSFADRVDETAALATLVCPDHHALEAWADAEPMRGLMTLTQPTVKPLFDTRAAVESLGTFAGEPRSAYDLMQATWRDEIFQRAPNMATFERRWADALQAGYFDLGTSARERLQFNEGAMFEAPLANAKADDGSLDVVVYPKVAMRDGRHAHNPWLQELPDPISKVSWDNYASLAPATAKRLGLVDGRVVRLEVPARGDHKARALDLPVQIQVGMAEDTVAIAMGYGRRGTDRFARIGPEWIEGRPTVEPGETIGANAAPLLLAVDGHLSATAQRTKLKKTSGKTELARTQIYDRLEVPKHLAPKGGEVRPFVQHTTLAAFEIDKGAGKPHRHEFHHELWADDHAETEGHHWGLAIDLAKCTGCAACVIACQSENNIPVVGKDEVRRQREMHWLRIDRYFRGDDDDLQVAQQPMMCQQCDHAPCETVCPVLATSHTSEGLNAQVYNRCVGTRYCSNNCPYKVRRFNWFDYPRVDQLQNMSLNPDVTVRSRGVMEKCTFCVQRIQEAKAEAKRQGRGVEDGDIQLACMQVCPGGAIRFGDVNDTASRVNEWNDSERAFRVLDEIGVRPSVAYLRQVKDRDESASEEKHHG